MDPENINKWRLPTHTEGYIKQECGNNDNANFANLKPNWNWRSPWECSMEHVCQYLIKQANMLKCNRWTEDEEVISMCTADDTKII